MRPQDKHDPGGKVRIKLSDGVRGEAVFSDCGRYRQSLIRDWTPEDEIPKSVLFVGMNPSTADAFASDPTVMRETVFSADWGFTRYLKANVLDWRATNPMDLPKDPQMACSQDNRWAISRMADEVDEIIMAYGRLPKVFQSVVEDIIEICRRSGKPMFCLGRNKDGSAKHPLYLAKTTLRVPF